MSEQASPTTACHACGRGPLALVSRYAWLRRVTSDCRPWPPGRALGVCQACGWVQPPLEPAWEHEAELIYAGYDIYRQSAGIEQQVFNQETGAAAARSERLLRAVWEHLDLPSQGRLLDVGCGNGSLLLSCHRVAPQWRLVGTELSEQHRARVEALPGVEAFHSGEASAIPGQYDLITLNHVLEHIPHPVEFLRGLRDKLTPGGVLVAQVPNLRENPFDLLVADHASHMLPVSLGRAAARAGFVLRHLATDWLPKEITLVAQAAGPPDALPPPDPNEVLTFVTSCVHWLSTLREDARQLAQDGAFGIFGTSIAATWLHGELDPLVRFLVDEDTSRVGREHLGRPVLSPAQVPAGSVVFLALPPQVARAVACHPEIAQSAASYRLPPALPQGGEAL